MPRQEVPLTIYFFIKALPNTNINSTLLVYHTFHVLSIIFEHKNGVPKHPGKLLLLCVLDFADLHIIVALLKCHCAIVGLSFTVFKCEGDLVAGDFVLTFEGCNSTEKRDLDSNLIPALECV